MKNDTFMLELFLKEASEHCSVLQALCAGNVDSKTGERSATSLKGAGRMLGLNKYASLCEKIENFLQRNEGAEKFNSSFCFAVEILSKIADCKVDEVEKYIEENSAKFDEALAFDFLAEDVSSTDNLSSENNTTENEQDGLPPIEASMKLLFLEEAKNHLSSISETLVELEGDFSNARKLEKLMRSSHSMKGASRVVGLSDIVAFTHEMENCFVSAQKAKIEFDTESLDVLLNATDFLTALCETGFETMSRTRYNSILENLKRVESGKFDDIKIVDEHRESVAQTTKAKRDDAYVRVSAKSLSSLMELSAEILIENRRIENYRESSASIKESQEQIIRQLESAMASIEGSQGSDASIARLEQLRKSMRALVDLSRAQAESLGEYSRRNVMLSGRLYAEVSASRMRPFSDGITMFPRLVRDLAKESGKKISLEIHGKDVPVDRDVLERLESPITHLLRNACDHGIELAQERIANGKQETGKIILSAWHSSGFLMLQIKDDGAGLDEEKIRAKILERNLVSAEILEKMSSDEVFEFLFLPNFTTKENVTELSGRGVGLDVVQTMLREVGGVISVSSKKNEGADFVMKLPITRSVIKSLTILIGGEPYALPLGRVYRTLKLSPSEIFSEDGIRMFEFEGRKVKLFSAYEILGFGREQAHLSSEVYVVVLSNKTNVFGFEVDDLPNEVELVARPLHESLGKIPCVSAVSLNEEGLPVLILDADDLIVYAEKFSERGLSSINEVFSETQKTKKSVLVVDDSATVRETQRKILESEGFDVDTAIDGVDGWNSFRLSKYDIIVSDVDMPRMTGFELVEKIRSINTKIPIVIVSYKDRTEDRARGRTAGANAYLTKSSFQDDSFLRTIRSLLKVES